MSVKSTINTDSVLKMTFIQTTSKKATETVTKNQTFIQKICNKLGENNKPIFTVMAIACGKGTVRPILSITDKKEKPDARKYAALRELMTEFIGVPTTLCAGIVAESLTGLIAKKGSTSYKNTKAVLSLLGICTAAGYLVPQFCNMFMPPVMKKLMPSYDPNGGSTPVPQASQTKQPVKNVNTPTPQKKIYATNMYPMSTYLHSGMKV